MARGAGVAAALSLLLWTCTPCATGEEADVPEALGADDECVAGDEQCALNALQLRGARLAADGPEDALPTQVDSLSGVDALKRKKKKKKVRKDITDEQADDFEENIVKIMKDIDKMEKKVRYYNEDIDNANGTMLSVKGATMNVNGTRVVWTNHRADWYPVFSLAQQAVAHRSGDHPELPLAELGPDDDEPEFIEYDDDEDVEDSEEDSPFETQSQAEAGKKKKKGKKKTKKVKKINLHRKVKAEMVYQQNRLKSFSPSLVSVKGRIAWMNDYMTTYTHIVKEGDGKGKPVLAQTPPGLPPDEVPDAPRPASPGNKKGGKKGAKDMKCTGKGKKKKCVPKKQLEDDLIKGIGEAQGMVAFIWDAIGKMDLEMETTKRRVELYVYGMTTATPWGPWTVHSSTSTSSSATESTSATTSTTTAATTKAKLPVAPDFPDDDDEEEYEDDDEEY